MSHRRRTPFVHALLAALVIAPATGSPASPARAEVGPFIGSDDLASCQVTRLQSFTAWLAANGVKGFVGEVGWPNDPADAAQWNALADAWYATADAADLWVTSWATGEWWGTSYRLAPYEQAAAAGPVALANPQASVLESHPSTSRYLRGVNVSGGEFGGPVIDPTSSFSNANSGAYGVDYHYDSRATFDYLASRGVTLVRIPFRWERIQPKLVQPLAQGEVQRLKDVIGRAHAAGLSVILDMHNYGAYYKTDGVQGVRRPIGSPQVHVSAFTDVWGRIARNFVSVPGLIGYGLMNEPVGLPAHPGETPAEVWARASQGALDAIRSWGDERLVLVGGYNWSGVAGWVVENPVAWIHDHAGNVRYEAHQYFDADHSGTYASSYEQEVAAAQMTGC